MTKSNSINQTKTEDKKHNKRTALTYIVSECALFVIIYFNLSVGAFHITLNEFNDYFLIHSHTKQTLLTQNIRKPRMLARIYIDAAQNLVRMRMPAMTRNPFASSQIFGINSGSSFVIVLITMIMPSMSTYATRCAFIDA